MHIDTVIRSLSPATIEELAKPNFVSRQGIEFKPIIVKSGEVWKLSPDFVDFNPFASGLLSSHGMMVKNEAAKQTLDDLKKVYPPAQAPALRVDWEPGMMVIVNQGNVFHRRFAEDGIQSAQRLLARARIFRNECVGKPDSDLAIAREREFGGLMREPLDLPRFAEEMQLWLGSREYRQEVAAQQARIASWSSEVPHFDRTAPIEHRVVERPPSREERRRARLEAVLALP